MKSTAANRLRENSQARREKQKEELRAAILREAGDEFAEFGYDGFSLRRVAERIGYSPTTIYLYFQNKDDLLLETVRDGFTSFDNAIQSAAQSSDPTIRLCEIGMAYFQFGVENPALYRLMFMQRADFFLLRLTGIGTHPDEQSELEAENALHHRVIAQELLVTAIQDGIKNGQFRPQDAILKADSLWASMHGLISLAISPLMSQEHARTVAPQLLEILIDGLK
jgi:AcrR family transcriptional regulator